MDFKMENTPKTSVGSKISLSYEIQQNDAKILHNMDY